MIKKLLLVDYENRHNLDLSSLDRSYSVIIFVGHIQNESKLIKKIDGNKSKYLRVDYLKVDGIGKNALDFHIAFKLGQIYETTPDLHCFVLAADQGYDPLIRHLNAIGLNCKRVEGIDDLPIQADVIKYGLNQESPELTTCPKCKRMSTIEHNGGRWCTNCGRFASPPALEITTSLVEKPRGRDNHDSDLIDRLIEKYYEEN